MTKTITHHFLFLTIIFQLIAFGIYAQPNFINKIPIPDTINANNGLISLVMMDTTHKFNPGYVSVNNVLDTLNNGTNNQVNGISTYCYNMKGKMTTSILAPTLIWNTGQSVSIHIKNKLKDTTTTHWHGAEVDPMNDGGPHQTIPPDSTWKINFPVLDSASTLWYHPHLCNETVEQVSMGLSGMIIVNQPNDKYRTVLPHTYGVDDIPIILGDYGVHKNSNKPDSILLNSVGAGGPATSKRPTNMVNGVTNPYVHLPRAIVRLRILNGSTRKGINFGFTPKYSDPTSTLQTFTIIATDGGYMMQSKSLTMLRNGPGARDEIILDLTKTVGDTLYMRNLKNLLPSSVIGTTVTAAGGGSDPTTGNAFLKIIILPVNSFTTPYIPITSVPTVTNTWGILQNSIHNNDSSAIRHRYKNLVGAPGSGFTIDGLTFDMDSINDTVCVNTKEVWSIYNKTAVAHPFHIHKIQFRILSIRDSLTHKTIKLDSLGLNGPKDDILILPNWSVSFMGYFDDYGKPTIEAMESYMYHCHILTHEDHIGGGMMHQFIVVNPGVAPLCSITTQLSDKQVIQSEMMLFPNPSTGDLYLQGEAIKPSSIRMMDAQGRLVKEQLLPVFTGHIKLNTEGLAKGLYMIEWRTNNESHLKKFVLE